MNKPFTPKNIKEAATGCLLGALVGDAAGATLEFMPHKPTEKQVDRALEMKGGGIMELAPGQITDDGELTLCLASALGENPGSNLGANLAENLGANKTFPLEKIAQNYAQWIESNPFDIGITTRRSLGAYADTQYQNLLEKNGYAVVMKTAALDSCMGSKANGSLMRISPLGIWGYQLDDRTLAQYAIKDSQLSHPNFTCCYAVACYSIALASLMREWGQREKAFQQTENWLKQEIETQQNLDAIESGKEVLGWLKDAQKQRNISYHPQIGFIKISFTHAFRHLLIGSTYIDALRETLLGGGDTDTNACIVGGLIGAACGIEGIPETMQKALLNCNTQHGKHPRPAFLSSHQIPLIIDNLL